MHYKCLKVFVCSAQGTATEEAAVASAIAQLNNMTKRHLGIEFERFNWQGLAPRSSNLPMEHKQDEINEHVEDCDIFILILWKRHGSYERNRKRTNLEREIDKALARLKKGSNLVILSYFRSFTVSSVFDDQERGVIKLRDYLLKKGVFATTYNHPKEFERRILPDLYEALLKLEFNTPKHQALRKFWKFGEAERPPARKLLIAYPGMNRAYMRLPEKDSKLWIRRLVPNIVYEDHRALQKIEKVLRLIQMNDFHTCTLANLPNDWREMNRCWVCIPRNWRALERLDKYSSLARFAVGKTNSGESFFWWRGALSSERFQVRSPLEQYLRLQRKEPALSGEWTQELRDVVARDYAIIARFPVPKDEIQMRAERLMEYFIGGIRGLGTWGAAWFLDRESAIFEKCKDFEPFQVLLEVTYMNGQIIRVRDISDENSEYFSCQMKRTNIKKTIKQFKIAANG